MNSAKAIEMWQVAIGTENVESGSSELKKYTNNVSGIERSIKAVLYPSTTDEVREIVKIANQFSSPLYPLSSGKNWGLGSRLPVESGAAIVDLKKMNKIHEVNTKFGYAVIEPGVTQRQLYKYICENNLPYMIDTTGSGMDSTFIGNAMDRGIGYYFPRAEKMTGMEVVLGNGRIIRTGFGHYLNSKSVHLYGHGIGPSLDGLFFQSNFGIVTRAGIKLIPKPEHDAALSGVLIDSENLPQFVDILADLKKKGVLQTSLHLANMARSASSISPVLYNYLKKRDGYSDDLRQKVEKIVGREIKDTWYLAFSGIWGSKRYIRESYKRTKKALRGVAEISLFTDRKLAFYKTGLNMLSFAPYFRDKKDFLNAAEPFYDHFKGVPSDAALEGIYWAAGNMAHQDRGEPDQSNAGKLYVLPIVPMEGESIREVVTICQKVIYDKYDFTPYITFNTLGSESFEGVINVAFDRS